MILDVESGAGLRRVDLRDYLAPGGAERAHEDAYAWIKGVRPLRIEGVPFRARFPLRGDSLWWSAELYLHKEEAILNVFRTIAAFDALVERDRPLTVRYVDGRYPGVIAQAAAARQIRYSGPAWPRSTGWNLLKMDALARGLATGARFSRQRATPVAPARARVAAFVHTAFWQSDGVDGSAESYIGPVLRAIETRVAAAHVPDVASRAPTNFPALPWWGPLAAPAEGPLVPVQRYAPAAALAAARAVYPARHPTPRSMWDSPQPPAPSGLRGCDCSALVPEQR